MYSRRFAALAALALTGALLLAGCGSSSKPAYCTQVSDVQSSLKALEEQNVSVSNASGLTKAVENVGTSANALVTALKDEFAPQTNAIKKSIGTIEKSVGEVSNGADVTAKVAAASAVPAEVKAISEAVAQIAKVTESKCD